MNSLSIEDLLTIGPPRHPTPPPPTPPGIPRTYVPCPRPPTPGTYPEEITPPVALRRRILTTLNTRPTTYSPLPPPPHYDPWEGTGWTRAEWITNPYDFIPTHHPVIVTPTMTRAEKDRHLQESYRAQQLNGDPLVGSHQARVRLLQWDSGTLMLHITRSTILNYPITPREAVREPDQPYHVTLGSYVSCRQLRALMEEMRRTDGFTDICLRQRPWWGSTRHDLGPSTLLTLLEQLHIEDWRVNDQGEDVLAPFHVSL